MADTAVQITAGTGTNIDTRTEATNGNHRQVIVIGDPSVNAGVAPVDATNGLTVTSAVLIPGTAATNLGKAEDGAHTSGDTGVFVLAVRTDTAAASSGTTGDYEALHTDSLGNLRVHIDDRQLDGSAYETVAASQTTQALGATGATGDYFRELLVIPATTSPGAISVKDGSNSAITVFTGGATSVSNLVPFTISLGLTSTSGAWQVTTGTNVSCIGIGTFT